ncbi:MAG: hypothetical protein WCF33_16585, partial [Pseudonocardiaceae bacterium]
QRQSATGPPDSYPDRTHTGKRRRARPAINRLHDQPPVSGRTAHYVQAESVFRRIRESSEIWIEVEKLRHENRLPERVTAALFDAAIGLRVRNSSYRSLLRGWGEEISNQVATTDLRAMVHAGLLRAHGKNRGAYYDAGNPLSAIRNHVRGARRPIDTSTLFDG